MRVTQLNQKKLKLEIESNSIENVTNKYNLELKGVAPFNRIRPDDSELPLPLIDKIFTSKLSDILIHNRSDQEVIVSQVEEIINAYGKDKSDMKAFNKRIEDDMSVDLLSQFSEVLRKKYKICVDYFNNLSLAFLNSSSFNTPLSFKSFKLTWDT